MGNVIESLLSGFAEAAGKFLASPLQFLAGQSCHSECGYTWDVVCYIEHFCIANLIKLGTIAVLSYIVLLLLYILYKIGLCGCVAKSLCKMVWACFSSCCYACEFGCNFFCQKLRRIRKKRKRDIELAHRRYSASTSDDEEEKDNLRHNHKHLDRRRARTRQWRKEHLRRSLRPRTHRVRVGYNGDSSYVSKRNRVEHRDDIRVSQTSKFVRKSGSFKEPVTVRSRM